MAFIKRSAILCGFLLPLPCLKSFLEPTLPVVFDGYYHPAFQSVADKFKANLKSGKERGGALAVYHKGRLVLDIWGGYADEEAQRPWQNDTMTIGYLNTKGIAAVVIARMAEKGFINYKSLVSDYWPEFAQNDKENITVEMLLSHQAGLAVLDKPINLLDIRDNPEKVEESLCSQRPIWPVGSLHGYHSITYGPYVDTLIRKADPKERNTQKIFQDDIAGPFEIDLFMNTPRDKYYRVARLYEDPSWKALLKSLTDFKIASVMMRWILFPNSIMARAVSSVTEFSKGFFVENNPYYREITLSCCHGTGTARGFAKVYGILSNGGMEGKHRLLSEDAIKVMTTPLVSGLDASLGIETRFGPGTGFKNNPKGELMFGHTGYGGQVAMADLSNRLGIAYLTNYISMYGMGDDPRYVDLENELYKCLDNYIEQEGLT
ncbi:beta-lactamase domain-containing protein 2-like [Mercenaria mercenaria]|uniref:beta-lactamase domain-containing protein 2-like n=1 Tax=Mercenaria mercenaria TaxID=6596 RepID=UPI00234EA117|nr:beta-lactamase domain-containing protein 2-like [Mercenaria mercenaria]